MRAVTSKALQAAKGSSALSANQARAYTFNRWASINQPYNCLTNLLSQLASLPQYSRHLFQRYSCHNALSRIIMKYLTEIKESWYNYHTGWGVFTSCWRKTPSLGGGWILVAARISGHLKGICFGNQQICRDGCTKSSIPCHSCLACSQARQQMSHLELEWNYNACQTISEKQMRHMEWNVRGYSECIGRVQAQASLRMRYWRVSEILEQPRPQWHLDCFVQSIGLHLTKSNGVLEVFVCYQSTTDTWYNAAYEQAS